MATTPVAQAHQHSPTGYCLCGLTPVLTPAQHAQHLTAVSA